MTASSTPTVTEHPELETLIEYAAGDLEPAEAEAVADHLVDCAECSEILLDVDVLLRTEGDDDDLAEALSETERATLDAADPESDWSRLHRAIEAPATEPQPQPRLEAAREPGAAVVPFAHPAPAEALRDATGPALGLWRALAAGLVLAVLGLGLWTASLRQANDELRSRLDDRVRPDLPIVYLDVTRSSGDVLRLDPRHDVVLLVVDPTADAAHYRATFADAADATIWRGPLQRSTEGGLRLGLPAPAAGTYRLAVDGGPSADGPWQELVTYSLRVETASADDTAADEPAGGG